TLHTSAGRQGNGASPQIFHTGDPKGVTFGSRRLKASQVTTGLAVAALALALVVTPAQAGTIVALPFPDNTTVDNHCTLREAIDAANTNLINPADCIWVGTPGVDDTILLNTGTYAIAAT